jgi:hypothetical protein
MRRKHTADEKEVKKPVEISKETSKPSELSDADLEKTAGGRSLYTMADCCDKQTGVGL